MRAPVLLVLLCAAAGAAQTLEDALHRRIGGFPGTVSLYARNLDSGAAVGIREAEPVRTASTIKLPIMLTVFDAVARGQAQWTEPLILTARDQVPGSGVLGSEFSQGDRLSLRDVMHLMIVLSDNTATNMILERFTADAVNAYLDRIGIHSTRSLRKGRETDHRKDSPPPGNCRKTASMAWAFPRRATWWPFSKNWNAAKSSAPRLRAK